MREREWVLIGGSIDAAGQLRIVVRSLDPQSGRDRSTDVQAAGPAEIAWPSDVALTIAAHGDPGACHFDGKIDRPRLYAAALGPDAIRALAEPDITDPALIAAWDFSVGIPTRAIHDRSTHRLDGTLHQTPTRGMTGANWNGTTERWTEAPHSLRRHPLPFRRHVRRRLGSHAAARHPRRLA